MSNEDRLDRSIREAREDFAKLPTDMQVKQLEWLLADLDAERRTLANLASAGFAASIASIQTSPAIGNWSAIAALIFAAVVAMCGFSWRRRSYANHPRVSLPDRFSSAMTSVVTMGYAWLWFAIGATTIGAAFASAYL